MIKKQKALFDRVLLKILVVFFLGTALYAQGFGARIKIPEGPLAVVTVRAGQLLQKADLSALKKSAGMRAVLEKYYDFLQESAWPDVLGDLSSVGLDPKAPWYIGFYPYQGTPLIAAITGLNDAQKWLSWIRKVENSDGEKKLDIHSAQGYKYYRSDEEVLVAWNSETVLILENEKKNREIEKQFLSQLFNADKPGLADIQQSFQQHLKKNWDMSLWIDVLSLKSFLSNKIAKDEDQDDFDFLSLFQDVSAESVSVELTFGLGVVDLKYRMPFDEGLKKFYIGRPVGAPALALYPSGIPLAEMALNLDAELIPKVLDDISPEGEESIKENFDRGLKDQGWSVQQLSDLVTGRLMFALYEQSGSTWPYEGVLILPLRDVRGTSKLLDLFANQEVLKKIDKKHYEVIDEEGEMPGTVNIRIQDGNLLVETSDLFDKHKGLRGEVAPTLQNLYNEKDFLFRLDIPGLVRSFPESEEYDSVKMMIQALVNGRLDGLSVSMGQENQDLVMQVRLETGEQQENSLYSLLSWYGDLLFKDFLEDNSQKQSRESSSMQPKKSQDQTQQNSLQKGAF